ncbi:DUF4836 family protein [Brachyspira hyodysenteriae]|uniref:DUF4836 domain-containing protein n=1 Tax=Brachyspira hyodysenteriae TaxID=159 RepID=UPI0022CD5132|nr:DUF4836 domain-containing protein [Brachyspira hyodysenteriae]MCZ9839841.1 DUF4836 family protein [Brachyspira hyodysenteriae]MCZ9848243.1 DUF4836 family protein [Brachyspira hyodysenteriae]MCZ9851914.1 DUF4836 family protein [Brachyspira hyodysenteriae]MCZ9861539.1 DUF4836 family protein [Brachyspira hyodysenteriae]MCZ9868772.1 DUF4836 family protein [Brachyspira hyodysenteriae]
MNRVVSLILLFLLTLSTFTYAVDKKYIPNNADSVFSINAGVMAEKGELNLQDILNRFFMQQYADRYLEYRDDAFVAEVMTNKLNDYIDFSKTSRIVFFNGYQQMTLLFDVKNITELDKLMIKMASQEDKLVSVAENAAYRYLALDEYNLISWNKEIFSITLKLKDNYWYNEELNKEDITNIANYVFINNTPLEDEKFLALENETNDSYVWANLSMLADEKSDFAKFLFGRSYDGISKEAYKDAIITTKINFNNGYAQVLLDSYTPNYPYDNLLLKKELSDNIYSFVNGENNYGFLSLAFNSKELSSYIKNIVGDLKNLPLSEELKALEENGIDPYKLIELLGGDIFVSVWDDDEANVDESPALLISASLTDVETVKTILEAFAEDVTDDIYTVSGYSCYIKDSILYISASSNVIDSIINGEKPAAALSADKIEIAKNNTMSLYLEFNPNLSLYGIGDEYSEAFESIYLTSNILESNHTQMLLKVTTRDKEKNSLSIIKSFFGL